MFIADSLWAGWSRDQILVGARFSAPIQTGPGAHPASYTKGIRSFLEVKWPRCGINHPLPYRADFKQKVELYLYSPSMFLCLYGRLKGKLYFYLLIFTAYDKT
jgi:hypothetical protein